MLSSFALQPLANASWLPCAVPALQKLLQCIQCAKYRACVQQRHASVALDASPRPVVHATINGMHVDVPQGTSILEAARKLQITVPTLCMHPRLVALGNPPPGTCRICLVDTGNGRLQPACATPLSEGMDVQTDTNNVRSNIKSVLSLLRANHPNNCMTCESNGRCEFQDLLLRYNVGDTLPKLQEYSKEWNTAVEKTYTQRHDTSSAALVVDLDKCIKCGRCVTACNMMQEVSALGMVERGRMRHPGKIDDVPLSWTKCIECGQCAAFCPTDAIHERTEWREVLDLLESGRKIVVCQTAPAVRVAIGEEFGLAPGTITTGQLVAAQRKLGFKYVFDTNFAADVTVIEEATELLNRLASKWTDEGKHAHNQSYNEDHSVLPMFSSCCPAWVNAVEKEYPALIPNVSSCRSPQMMLASVIKRVWAPAMGFHADDVVNVSIMPCTAKKHEASLSKFDNVGGGHKTLDYVLTTREFGEMLRHAKVPLPSMREDKFDSPMGMSTGAAALFGATGGVMEAAVRTLYHMLTGEDLPMLKLESVRGLQGIKDATIDVPWGGRNHTVRVAVASGIANAKHLLQAMHDGKCEYDFIEVMACPGGCIGGGGQPKSLDPLVLIKRMQGIYALDEASKTRQSHHNPEVKQLYKVSLGGKPGTEQSHELLHTSYEDVSSWTVPAKSRNQ